MAAVTNKELRSEYRRLNERFFGGSLPEDTTVRFGDLEDEDEDGYCAEDEIVIDKDLRKHGDLASIILLHEMTHLSLGPSYRGYPSDDGHGMRFQAEIVRLFEAGAYDGLL